MTRSRAATVGTGQEIEVEHAAHQRRPGPGARGGGGAGAGLELARIAVTGPAAVADGLGAPARMWGEDAVIQDQVDHGAGDDGRELLHELDRLEEEMGSAIAPHRLEFDEDVSVGPELDAVLGERGGGGGSDRVVRGGRDRWGDPDVGVEIDAIELGLTGASRG